MAGTVCLKSDHLWGFILTAASTLVADAVLWHRLCSQTDEWASPRPAGRGALVGRPRNTICRWLVLYAAKGFHVLLELYVAAGKPVSLATDVRASLEQALYRPEGFTS